MPGSPTTPGRAGPCADAPAHVAFRYENSVGTRDSSSFAAQWLAYAHPYRRFTAALAGDGARLGADVDRYSFTVVDLHHLLPAGLPAHSHPTVGRRTVSQAASAARMARPLAPRMSASTVPSLRLAGEDCFKADIGEPFRAHQVHGDLVGRDADAGVTL